MNTGERHRLPLTQILYDSIEKSLDRRTTPPDTAARQVEDLVKQSGSKAWGGLKRHSSLGVVTLGVLGVVLAEAVGAGELAFGVAVAYAGFRVLRRGEPVEKAVEEVLHR